MKNVKPRNKESIKANKEIPKKKEKVAKKEIKKKIFEPFRGIHCDSDAERYTLMWLFELKDNGFIDVIERAESYMLAEPIQRNYIRRLKSRGVSEQETLLRGAVYTPDFKIILSKKGMHCGIFFDIHDEQKLNKQASVTFIHQNGVVFIETKGTSARTHRDTREKFEVERKWLWQRHKIYVNLFIHDRVFPKTFTPQDFMLTDKQRKERTIHFHKQTLDQFLNLQQ